MSESGLSSNSDDGGIDDGPAPKRRRVPLDEQDEYREYDQPAEEEDESDDSLEFEAGFDEAEEGEGSGDEQPGAEPQPPQQPHGDDGEAEEEAEEEGLADPRLLMKIEDMPGFSKEMMGHDIKPSPASYQTGLSGYWAPWSKTSSPFTPGNEPRPARVLCHTIVSEFIAKDAARIGEWETLSDPAARARQVTSAALLGMLTTGTAKGWTCTDEHTELLQAASQDKDLSEAKAKLNGNVKTYTYKPHANHLGNDQTKRDLVSTQFGWFLEELYSPDKSKVVAIRIFKLIYCASHSDDELWRNLIEETSEITRAGNINAIPEALRRPRMMTQNKLQRTQINDEDLENTASTQWKRIDSMSALTKHLLHHAGAGDGSRGRPLYADMAKETAAGCIDRSLESDKKWGGKHPLGPSVALNFKRFLKPNVKEPGHPGINVAIAGTVDAAGNPLKILPVQCDPNNYFDDDGTFRPPDEVEELGALWACHDNSVKNIFNVPFPRPVHGSVVPDDGLLRAFFDLRKNDDKMLRRTQRGDHPKEFEEVRDIVEVAFNSMATERDAVAAAISKGILNTEMLSYDSMDKTVAEQERLDRRAYEKRNVDKVGEVWVLEPRQVCKDISLEIERIFSMVDEYDKRERVEHARTAKHKSRIQRREDAIVRQKKHCDLVESCIRLGVRRFEHAFASKKLASTIPPGWRDICHTGLRAALKESAEIGVRLAGRNMGRKVDPDHVNAKQGTANMAFAHGQTLVRKDLTPWGHWRCFLTHMLSAGVKIQGDQVRLMLEAWIHAVRRTGFAAAAVQQLKPFDQWHTHALPAPFVGMGKSMRAKRLQAILCKGWVANSGSASAKAGMNGGMDHLCGRLVYYDEVTTDFGSADSDRIEYLKTITMEQHADLQRTVKTMGTNGLESFTTIHLETLHFESHMMSTNCGPLGIKSDVEPGTNRAALSDRSVAHVVHAADDAGQNKSDGEFSLESASDNVREQVNRLRVISCLMAYGLVFIKHLPHCQPNITYARELTNKWDDIQNDEFNLPRPSRRKKLKRKMMFHVFAMESAMVEKFLWKHTAIDFKDMLPDANGNLSGFCIDQLVDVIRSLQRCLDHETILNAWSHNLDHSPPTTSHVFQMKTVLSQLHGADLDFRTLCGKMPQQAEDARSRAGGRTTSQAAAGGAHQGVAPVEPDDDQSAPPPKRPKTAATPASAAVAGSSSTPRDGVEADDALEAALSGGAGGVAGGVAQPPTTPPAPPLPPQFAAEAEAEAAPVASTAHGPAGAAPEDESRSDHTNEETLAGEHEEEEEEEEEVVEVDNAGVPTPIPPQTPGGVDCCDRVQTKGIMQDGMTRRDCGRLAEQLETHRQLRADYSNRLAARGASAISPSSDPNRTALDTVADAMTDAKTKRGKAVHLHASTGKRREAKRAAAAILPTTQDVLASGIDDQFLKDIVQGRSSGEFGRPEWHHLLGLKRNLPWDYELLNHNSRAEAREGNNTGAAGGGGGGGGDGASATQSNRLLGPAEYDFNWAMHKSFSKNRTDSSSLSGGKRKSTWTNATRVVKAASANARTNFFSLMHQESMTFESMRDTLFMMAQPAPENQVRIPTFSHQQTTILNNRKMMHNTQKILETSLPNEVHPYGMFEDCDPSTSSWKLKDAFKKPEKMARPFDNSIVGDSGYQKRLDHLNRHLALPVVATPVSFSRGVPIKESEQGSLLFNKWIAREHSNLVVEAGVFLSRIPGVAGGDCKHIPDTFREPSALQKRRRERKPPVAQVEEEVEHDDEQLRADDFPNLFAANDADDRDDSAPEDGQRPPTAEEHAGEELRETAPPSEQPTAADAARVDASTGQAASDVRPVVDRVSAPHQHTSAPGHARAGAAKVAAAMSVDEDARVNALPYEWDMLQLFLTYKMAGTLHHDVKDYVDNMRREFKQVFGKETPETTLRDLPQMVLRFPGLCDRDAVLQPLSVRLSLDQPEGRYEDLGNKHKSATVECSDLTKSTIHSISNGRQVKHDDPEVLAFEAEQRGLDTASTLKGNLFSRSAWLRFTLAQLDRRGMLTDKERERVHDQGICLRQRVVHEASCAGTSMRTWLGQKEPLPCGSFEARERIKRETGVDDRAGSKRLREQVEEDDDDVLGLARPFLKPECAGAFQV